MSNLSNLQLKVAYHKGKDNVADDFYLPCLRSSLRYDRAVAYFSSSIYVLAWPAMKEFVSRGGKIRMICSPFVSSYDAKSLESVFNSQSAGVDIEKWSKELDRLLKSPALSKPAMALSALVATGVLDFRIAVVRDPGSRPQHDRLFHSKLGLFYDGEGNTVAFKGSMNESAMGLSADGNIETVDVFVSHAGGRDTERIAEETRYFDSLWAGTFPGVQVQACPAALKELIVRASDGHELSQLLDAVDAEIIRNEELAGTRGTSRRNILPHQKSAIEAWEQQGRRGILEHATGSGKTFTAICAIRDALKRGERPLVLVPSELLLEQWQQELKETLSNLSPQILCAGAGYDRWKTDGLLNAWAKAGDKPRIVLATMQTACSNGFLQEIGGGKHLFIVADEVHRIGSPEFRKTLTIPSGPRLGLSATPRRAGDPEGTQVTIDYFGAIVQPPFSLKDAILADRLTPYFYNVQTVQLTQVEQNLWDEKTEKISQLYARIKNENTSPVSSRLKLLLIERSRIAKSADAKPQLALDVIKKHYKKGDRWIVYCDTREQLTDVLALVQTEVVNSYEYYSGMPGDRVATLQTFNSVGGVIVSIKCLDEGIDIPATSHALILASSKNPREFIQRRGRVLRKYPGKQMATIHDVVVLPGSTRAPDSPESSLLRGEIARAIQFGKDALNPTSVIDLQRIAVSQGINFESLMNEGYEENE